MKTIDKRKQIDHENMEVLDHGIEHEQYFQGCGVAFTDYEHVVTGCGNDASEALEDCLEQIAMNGYDVDALDVKQIIADNRIDDTEHVHILDEVEHAKFTGNPTRKCQLCKYRTMELDEEWEDHHYYISIRFNEVKPNETLQKYMMENGKVQSYAFPGGYPIYYITADNGVLCPDCVNKNMKLLNDKNDKQWYVIGAECNYEDDSLCCDNCNNKIESAYGNPETENK